MPRFFIRREQIENDTVTLVGDDAHHIARSLRMAVGDKITVCDMQGFEYDCRIKGFDEDRRVFAEILSSAHSDTEPCCRVTLFQALSKGDKMDTVIQKSVECGVCRIIPFESERCVVKAKDGSEDKKNERRRRIAAEAAKQCGRSIIPSVENTVSFSRMLELAMTCDIKLFCYEGDGTVPLGLAIKDKLVADEQGKYPTVAVIIGSEGGFSQKEAAEAVAAGMMPVGLGKRILRTETAPIFVLSNIVFATDLLFF